MKLLDVIRAYAKLMQTDVGAAGRWLDDIGVHPVIRRAIVRSYRAHLG